jgi:hypothetical protein
VREVDTSGGLGTDASLPSAVTSILHQRSWGHSDYPDGFFNCHCGDLLEVT